MNRPLASIAILAILAALGGCDEGPDLEQEEQHIRSAIGDFLRNERGINPDAMQMQLAELQIDGDRAQVVATFSSSQPGSEVQFEYSLQRDGDGWKVLDSTSRGTTHGNQTAPALPEGHPPVPSNPPAAESPPAQDGP